MSVSIRGRERTVRDLARDLGPEAPVIEHATGARESVCPFALDAAPGALGMVVFGYHQDLVPPKLNPWEIVEDLLTWVSDRECAGGSESVEPLVHAARSLVAACGHGDSSESKARVLLEVGRVLHHGETRYGRDNWRGIPARQHVRHALAHCLGHIAGDRSEGEHGHLLRAICRVLLAIEVEISKPPGGARGPG